MEGEVANVRKTFERNHAREPQGRDHWCDAAILHSRGECLNVNRLFCRGGTWCVRVRPNSPVALTQRRAPGETRPPAGIHDRARCPTPGASPGPMPRSVTQAVVRGPANIPRALPPEYLNRRLILERSSARQNPQAPDPRPGASRSRWSPLISTGTVRHPGGARRHRERMPPSLPYARDVRAQAGRASALVPEPRQKKKATPQPGRDPNCGAQATARADAIC
jgi:hypothetical protein